jgi:hypothetical protein
MILQQTVEGDRVSLPVELRSSFYAIFLQKPVLAREVVK